jgi:DNA polymerase-3 subunit epsilon
MKFIALDFETANMWKGSICQVGITVVDSGNIVQTESWLVNPDSFFDDFNVRIHGITPEMVKSSPKFKDLWPEISHYFDGDYFIVAHNARFDILALDDILNSYENNSYGDIEPLAIVFACSMAMARRTWPKEPSYSLQSLCSKLNIEYGNHNAGADSKSCAELTIKIFQEKGVDFSMDIDSYDKLVELENSLQIYFGRLNREGFVNSVCKHLPRPAITKSITGNIEKKDPDSIFYQKRVVFTGTLSSMTRNEALQKIADVGGYPSDSISSLTNILVVGQQDYRIVGESGMSSKQKKAIEIKNKGSDIEIMTEDDFLKNI